MSVHRPQEVDIPETELSTEPGSLEGDVGSDDIPRDDADRDVVEHRDHAAAQLPDDVDPGDFLEQSLIVDYDEDDYR